MFPSWPTFILFGGTAAGGVVGLFSPFSPKVMRRPFAPLLVGPAAGLRAPGDEGGLEVFCVTPSELRFFVRGFRPFAWGVVFVGELVGFPELDTLEASLTLVDIGGLGLR